LREVFEQGGYVPLAARGERGENVCAFLRVLGPTWVLAVAPRLLSKVMEPDRWPLGAEVWKETTLILPEGAPVLWGDGFTGTVIEADSEDRSLSLSAIFDRFPVALLRGI
jgi:(1->4)-alpha-D-glucan 1-alpha-D-glucosylmutase